MDEETIKELYEISLDMSRYRNNPQGQSIQWRMHWTLKRYIDWFQFNSELTVNKTFKDILKSYFNLFNYKFDKELRDKLSQLLDTDDVANHHIAFRLIYQQFKNT